MESEAGVNGGSPSWSSETNWTVVRGSLVNSVTFESSFSVINADDDLKSTAKRCPLILKPTAPDSTPCEITISFAQKHELRQIYVKSTACVYEIYRRSNQQSENEYVWTVRCSAAAADQNEDHEAQSVYPNGSHENHSRENPGVESNRNGSSEEEWVKVPDSSSPSIKQEYYEATAQISDVDPCESVTIRFLSVQSKESVFIDEVYVFADPFESTEPENSNGNYTNGNNSLMAMLLPSLSLMSKSKNSTGKIEEKKPNSREIPSEPSRSNEGRESPANDRVGRSLDQLLSRIGRIEDMFSRLEENLLKPINGIEARLGRVEKQLEELLSDKPKPDLNCENDYQRNSNSDSNLNLNLDLDSNSNLNSVPSLVITAPEFSNCDDDDDNNDDDEEENVGLCDIVAEISVDQPKRGLTVDDALAAALAGLMIGSEKDQTTPPGLSISAPEFNEDIESGDEKGSSPRGQQDLERSEETESQKGSASICIEVNIVEDCSKDGSEEEMKNALNEVKSQHELGRLEETESEKGSLSLSLNTNMIEDYSKDRSGEETKNASNEVKSQHDLDRLVESNSQNGLVSIIEVSGVEDHSKDRSEEESTITLNEVQKSQHELEKPEETENRNSLHEILGSFFSIPSSSVDFESPVLDVKFLSSGGSDFSLEVLLSGEEETCAAEKSQPTGQSENECCELISVEDGGDELAAAGPVIDSEIFVDVNYCNVQEDDIQLPSGTFPTNLI